MTVTALAKQQTGTTLRFTPGQAEHLARVLANCLIFTSSDITKPMLRSVRFEFDGTDLTVVSTDTYRLCFETVPYDEIDTDGQHWARVAPDGTLTGPHGDFAFLLDIAAAKGLLAFLKGNRRDPIELRYDEPTVQVASLTGKAEWARYDASFPTRWRTLLPDPDKAVAVPQIAFNPSFLSDMAKVRCAYKVATVTITLFGETKPSLITFHDGPTVLLMPVRLK